MLCSLARSFRLPNLMLWWFRARDRKRCGHRRDCSLYHAQESPWYTMWRCTCGRPKKGRLIPLVWSHIQTPWMYLISFTCSCQASAEFTFWTSLESTIWFGNACVMIPSERERERDGEILSPTWVRVCLVYHAQESLDTWYGDVHVAGLRKVGVVSFLLCLKTKPKVQTLSRKA